MTRASELAVDAIYEAALDATRWPAALAIINQLLCSIACGLRHQSFATGAFGLIWLGLEPQFERRYVEHYHRCDPWIEISRALPEGARFNSEAALPLRELQRTAFYNELCKPFEIRESIGAILLRTPDELVSFGALRRAGATTFGESEARLLAELVPHLRRAHDIQQRLDASDDAARVGWAALDRLPAAVLLLDMQHRLVRANASAERLLASGSVLVAGAHGALDAAAPANRRAWMRVMSGKGGAAPVALARQRGRPLLATSIPIRTGTMAAMVDARTAARLVVVSDPDHEPTSPASLIASMFGLTRTEAAVALAVGRGHAPKEVAEMLGTTWNTVRGQLKVVYAKTGTNGQPGLVRLIANIGLLTLGDRTSGPGPEAGAGAPALADLEWWRGLPLQLGQSIRSAFDVTATPHRAASVPVGPTNSSRARSRSPPARSRFRLPDAHLPPARTHSRAATSAGAGRASARARARGIPELIPRGRGARCHSSVSRDDGASLSWHHASCTIGGWG